MVMSCAAKIRLISVIRGRKRRLLLFCFLGVHLWNPFTISVMVMFVRSHNPFNLCNPWSKKTFTVVWGLHLWNPFTISVMAMSCTAKIRLICVIRGPKRRLLFTVVCLYPCNPFIVNVIRGRDCSSRKLSRITQSGRQTISSTEDATPYMHTRLWNDLIFDSISPLCHLFVLDCSYSVPL